MVMFNNKLLQHPILLLLSLFFLSSSLVSAQNYTLQNYPILWIHPYSSVDFGFVFSLTLSRNELRNEINSQGEPAPDRIEFIDPRQEKLGQVIEQLFVGKYPLVVAVGPEFLDTIHNLAVFHKETKFAIISGDMNFSPPLIANNNVKHLWGDLWKGSYLAGIYAGLTTIKQQIGYITGTTNNNFPPEFALQLNAFALGVKSVNPIATIKTFSVGNYLDQDKAVDGILAFQKKNPSVDVISQDVYHVDVQRKMEGARGAGVYYDMSKVNTETEVSAAWDWKKPLLSIMTDAVNDNYTTSSTWYPAFVDTTDPYIVDIILYEPALPNSVKSAINSAKVRFSTTNWSPFCDSTFPELEELWGKSCLTEYEIRSSKLIFPWIVDGGSLSDANTVTETQTEPSQKSENGGDTQTVMIAVVVALAALVIIVVAPVIYFLVRRKESTRKFKVGPQPDFSAIAFSTTSQNISSISPFSKKASSKIPSSVLLDPRFILSLTEVLDFTDISAELMTFYQFHGQGMDLLSTLIAAEVESCQSAQTLFRETSVCSETFKHFSKLVGLKWLWKVFAPMISEVRALGGKKDKSILSAKSLEVNPELIEAPEDEIINKLHLQVISQQFLNAIVKATSSFPPELRLVCNVVRTEVAKKYGDEKYKAVGAFVFLRFLCPAIVFPQEYGLLTERVEPQAQRFLLLVAKVLQNLANEVEFGEKETYMAKLNDFITTNLKSYYSFVDAISLESTLSSLDKKGSQCVEISKDMKSNCKRVIGQFLLTNKHLLTDDQLSVLNIERNPDGSQNSVEMRVLQGNASSISILSPSQNEEV